MDHNDRQAIEGLFGKLSEASRSQPYRDAEAEAAVAAAEEGGFAGGGGFVHGGEQMAAGGPRLNPARAAPASGAPR